MNAGVWLRVIFSLGITASLTALVLMGVRLLWGKHFPKSTLSLLWLVVVFQMLSPISVVSVFSLENLLPVRSVLVERVAETMEEGLTGLAGEGTPAASWGEAPLAAEEMLLGGTGAGGATGNRKVVQAGIWWYQHGANLLLLGWATGLTIVIGRSVYLHQKLQKRWATATLFQDKALLAECLQAAQLNRPVPVYVTEHAESPFVTGLFRPRVIIPASLLLEAPEDVKWVLLHEFCHLRRGDQITKFLAFLGLAVHWVNPVLWAAFFLLERDMEMACDEKVLTLVTEPAAAQGPLNQQSYATSLLRMAVAGEGYARGALTFAESNVSRRIKNIVSFRPSRPRVKIVSAVIAVVLVLVLLPQYSADGRVLSLSSLQNGLGFFRAYQLPGSILLLGADENGAMDTVMILNQRRDGTVHVAHIPRDTWVRGLADLPQGQQKLSGYLKMEERETALDYLSDLWNIQLDYYLVADLELIRDLVDLAGGLEYEIPFNMVYNDPYADPPLIINIPAGFQRLSGENVEKLLRYRSGYAEGDLGRMGVQQDVLRAVKEQLPAMMSGLTADDLAAVVMNHEVDTNLSFAELAQTAGKLIADHDQVVFQTLSWIASQEPPYFVTLSEANLAEVFAAMELSVMEE